MSSLGLYVSIPFCRAKCSFCNFASDAYAPGMLPIYLEQLGREIASARVRAARLGATLPDTVDTLYLGGGTPSLLSPPFVHTLFTHLRDQFVFAQDVEITVECAPGQLSPATLEAFLQQGVNRLSFGVQSFVDAECSAVGRTHRALESRAEIDRLRSAGVVNVSLDLIAGLPHQTESTWRSSVQQAIEAEVPHLSVYMLEIDEDSRLGREILREGSRYSAAAVPTDDASASFYETACELLGDVGIHQYEISNYARPDFESRHNLKYWTRAPYLGFGLDAHSMLKTDRGAVRFANTDDLSLYLANSNGSEEPDDLFRLLRAPMHLEPTFVTHAEAFEEALFLGLRLNHGISLSLLQREFGETMTSMILPAVDELVGDGLLTRIAEQVTLTGRGRVLSNDVFSRLLISDPTSCNPSLEELQASAH